MAHICIYDGKEVEKGYPVKEDFVIRTIANIKKRMGSYKGNKLYVCEEHYELWKKRRKDFKNSIILSSVVVLVMMVFGAVYLFGSFSIQNLLNFLILLLTLALVLFLFPLLAYTPNVENRLVDISKREEKGKKVKPSKPSGRSRGKVRKKTTTKSTKSRHKLEGKGEV